MTINNENNPFPVTTIPEKSASVISDSEQQRAIAEIQSSMLIAKNFPRDQRLAMDRIIQACTRPTLAEGALYSYSKGGTEITGPSIRLAEAIAQAWGNMQFGIRELDQREGESTIESYAWDIESNTRQVKVFQVKHKRKARGSIKTLDDPREIYELTANQGARRLRACILGIIPGDVVEAAVKQCEETLKISCDTSPDAIKKMAECFGEFKVSSEMIQKRIQCRLEAIRPAQMVQMKKIYASLRDGMSIASDWFEGGSNGESKLSSAIADAAKTGTEKEEAPATEETPGNDQEEIIKCTISTCKYYLTINDSHCQLYENIKLCEGERKPEQEETPPFHPDSYKGKRWAALVDHAETNTAAWPEATKEHQEAFKARWVKSVGAKKEFPFKDESAAKEEGNKSANDYSSGSGNYRQINFYTSQFVFAKEIPNLEQLKSMYQREIDEHPEGAAIWEAYEARLKEIGGSGPEEEKTPETLVEWKAAFSRLDTMGTLAKFGEANETAMHEDENASAIWDLYDLRSEEIVNK